MWRQAGYEVQLREPDVLVTAGQFQFGIAAKRPRSVAKLSSNIRKANKQIMDSGHPGIVAIDLNCLVSPTDVHIITDDFRTGFAEVINKANSFVHQYASRVRSLVDPDRAFGVAVHFSMPIRVLSKQPRLGWARRLALSNFCHLSDPRATLLAQAAERMAAVQDGYAARSVAGR